MNFFVKKANRLIALGILGLAAATAIPAQAADRQDVIAGVIVGATAGYILSEHNGHVRVIYRDSDHRDYHHDNYHHDDYRHDNGRWHNYHRYDHHHHNRFCHHDAREHRFGHGPQASFRHTRDFSYNDREHHH